MKFYTRKFNFGQKFRRPEHPKRFLQNVLKIASFRKISKIYNLKISRHRLAWEQQKHAFRKVSTAEMRFALRFAIITQKLAPVGSSKDLRKVRNFPHIE